MFVESLKFFDLPTTKWLSFKFFEKLNENHILMINFSKLSKYQTFGLIELHNLSKGQLADRIFKLWKSCVDDYRVVEHTTFEILTCYFLNLQKTFVKSFFLKLPIKFYHFSNIYDLEFLDNETTALWLFFWNLYGRAFCFLNFVKQGKY